jgi:hypothetical protein
LNMRVFTIFVFVGFAAAILCALILNLIPVGRNERAFALEQCLGERPIGQMPTSVNCFEVCYNYVSQTTCYQELRSTFGSNLVDSCLKRNTSGCWE